MKLLDWDFERFHAVTRLPRKAYEEWLSLPGELDRRDVLELMADPEELQLFLAMLKSGAPPMFG